jgi:outer membrane autotransporter protein
VKKSTLALVVAILTVGSLVATDVQAQDRIGWYASGNIGVAFLSDSDMTLTNLPGVTLELETDTGYGLSAAGGYDWGVMRLEGELAYQRNGQDKLKAGGAVYTQGGNASIISGFVNAYVDGENDSALTPYFTIGVGFAKSEFDTLWLAGTAVPPFSGSDTVLVGQVGLGADYALTPQWALDLKYRYLFGEKPEHSNVTWEMASHNFYLGVRYYF